MMVAFSFLQIVFFFAPHLCIGSADYYFDTQSLAQLFSRSLCAFMFSLAQGHFLFFLNLQLFMAFGFGLGYGWDGDWDTAGVFFVDVSLGYWILDTGLL